MLVNLIPASLERAYLVPKGLVLILHSVRAKSSYFVLSVAKSHPLRRINISPKASRDLVKKFVTEFNLPK